MMAPDKIPALEQFYKSIQTFGDLQMAAENRDKLYRYHDALMQSLYSILDDRECDEAAKLETFNTTMEQYTAAMKELFPKLISGKADDSPKVENTIGKSDPNRFVKIVAVEKFNPYHDSLGRFATSSGYASFTIRTRDPGKQHMANAAIAREKERAAAAEAAAKPKFTFTPAKTKKEAVAYAQDELGFTKVSYGTKLDIDTINHINEQIARVQQQYPEVKGAVTELKTWSKANAYAAIETSADGSMNFLIGTKLYGNGLESVKRQYDSDVKSGFHPEGTTAGSIIYHEFGHVLANISAKKSLGVSANGKIAANYTDRASFISNRRNNTTERGWVADAAKSTGTSARQLQANISRYGQKNAGEAFAEAFSEVMGSSSPRESSVALVKASGWYR